MLRRVLFVGEAKTAVEVEELVLKIGDDGAETLRIAGRLWRRRDKLSVDASNSRDDGDGGAMGRSTGQVEIVCSLRLAPPPHTVKLKSRPVTMGSVSLSERVLPYGAVIRKCFCEPQAHVTARLWAYVTTYPVWCCYP